MSFQLDYNFYNRLDIVCDTLESWSVLQDVNMARHHSNKLTYTLHLWNLFTAFQQPRSGSKLRRGVIYVYRVNAASIKDEPDSSVSIPLKVKRLARLSNQDDGLRRSDTL